MALRMYLAGIVLFLLSRMMVRTSLSCTPLSESIWFDNCTMRALVSGSSPLGSFSRSARYSFITCSPCASMASICTLYTSSCAYAPSDMAIRAKVKIFFILFLFYRYKDSANRVKYKEKPCFFSIEKNGCFGTYPIFMRVQSQWGMRRQKNTRMA